MVFAKRIVFVPRLLLIAPATVLSLFACVAPSSAQWVADGVTWTYVSSDDNFRYASPGSGAAGSHPDNKVTTAAQGASSSSRPYTGASIGIGVKHLQKFLWSGTGVPGEINVSISNKITLTGSSTLNGFANGSGFIFSSGGTSYINDVSSSPFVSTYLKNFENPNGLSSLSTVATVKSTAGGGANGSGSFNATSISEVTYVIQ